MATPHNNSIACVLVESGTVNGAMATTRTLSEGQHLPHPASSTNEVEGAKDRKQGRKPQQQRRQERRLHG